MLEATCEGIDGTWLDLPATLLGDSLATLVLRHVRFEGEVQNPSKAIMELARFKLSDGTCSKEGKVAQVVLMGDELKAYTNNPAKVRSLLLGQSVVADIDDDGKLDFVLAQKYDPARTVVRLNVFGDP